MLIWALEDAGGSWQGFGIMILIQIWSLVFGTPISKLWLFILILKVQRHRCPLNPHCVLWRTLEFLTGVWHLDLDSDLVTGLWYNHDPSFDSLSWFCMYKEHPCPLRPYLVFWWGLVVTDWGLVSWSWFGYSHWSVIHLYSKFWLSIYIFRCKEHPCSLSPHLGLWKMALQWLALVT